MIKNVLLFLGSGISFPSGLPCVKTITNRILNEKWHKHSNLNFYKGEHPNKYFKQLDITPKVQEFLKILKNFTESLKRKNQTNYEDLFYLCQQIVDNESSEIENPLIIPFLNKLKVELTEMERDILSPIPSDNATTIDLKYLAEEAAALIQCVVWDSLLFDGKPSGLDLIIELKKNIDSVDIVTLNHDILIEKFLQEHNIKFVDGFGEPEGEIRYFNPMLYDTDVEIKLFKLHGSINWYRFRILQQKVAIDKFGLALKNDIDHLKDAKNHPVMNLRERPLFLVGSYNKMFSYNFGIFRTLHCKFDQALYRNKLIIMSGYGWNDRGINGRILEWLYSSYDNKLILLHEKPENLIKQSKSALWHRYDELVQTNRLVPITRWFSDVSFSEISEYFK